MNYLLYRVSPCARKSSLAIPVTICIEGLKLQQRPAGTPKQAVDSEAVAIAVAFPF